MKVNAKEFSAALARVLPVLKTRTTLPILTCAKVEAKGSLRVTTTDLDAHATASCPCEGELAPVCVNANVLNYLVRQAPETIELTMDGPRLLVRGLGTMRLPVYAEAEFPVWPKQAALPLAVNILDLADCFRAVSWAPEVNTKDSDFWKEMILVRTTAKSLETCGSNGKEFAYAKLSSISTPEQFLIPARQADLLIHALATGAHTVSLSESWLFSTADNFSLAIKLAENKYVPFEKILNQDKRPLGVLDLSPVIDSLHTIKAMGREEPFLTCRLEFTAGALTILYRTPTSDFERSMPHTGEAVAAFNLDVNRALRVFAHVRPGALAWLTQSTVMFTDGDHTVALALIS